MAAGERETELLEVLGRVVRGLARLSGNLDEGPPLTATQRLCLFEVFETEPVRLSDLADRLGVSAPTASRAVDALVEHGLLARTADPDDRRAVRISSTEPGRARISERKARVLDAFLPAASAMPAADQEQLIELLSGLADALSGERAVSA